MQRVLPRGKFQAIQVYRTFVRNTNHLIGRCSVSIDDIMTPNSFTQKFFLCSFDFNFFFLWSAISIIDRFSLCAKVCFSFSLTSSNVYIFFFFSHPTSPESAVHSGWGGWRWCSRVSSSFLRNGGTRQGRWWDGVERNSQVNLISSTEAAMGY